MKLNEVAELNESINDNSNYIYIINMNDSLPYIFVTRMELLSYLYKTRNNYAPKVI